MKVIWYDMWGTFSASCYLSYRQGHDYKARLNIFLSAQNLTLAQIPVSFRCIYKSIIQRPHF